MGKYLRGQSAVIEIADAGGTDIPVGVLDNPEVAAPEQEVQYLRGAGSTEWVDKQKTETSVRISGEVAEFDLDAWDQLIDYDSTAEELDDSADVKDFTVTMTYKASDGSTKEIPVLEAHVEGSVPLGGSRDEWIGMDLEFTGRTLGAIVNTDATA